MKKNKLSLLILFAFLLCCENLLSQKINHVNFVGPIGLQVNTFSGNLFYQRNDLTIPCRGFPLDVTFYYNSQGTANDYGFGKGWSMSYSMIYKRDGNNIIIGWSDARQDVYTFNGNGFTPPIGFFTKLEEIQPNVFKLTTKEGICYFFEDPSHRRMTRMTDPNNNELTIAYTNARPTTITDPSGRSIELSYINDHLSEIRDPNRNMSRVVRLEYNAAFDPIKVINFEGGIIQYEYDIKSNMTKIIDESGYPFQIQYIFNNIFMTEAFVRRIITPHSSADFSYNAAIKMTTVTEPVDNIDQITTYKYNQAGNIEEKMGNCCGFHEKYFYDAQNNMVRKTDARQKDYFYTYDAFGNLLTETAPVIGTITGQVIFSL